MLERAALIAAARKQDWKKLPDILAYLASPDREEIHTVSLVRLLAECPADDKWPVLRNLMTDPSPLVRASVAEALGQRLDQPNTAALLKATGDDYRLVRVRAATALAAVPEDSLPEDQRRPVRARDGRTDGFDEVAPGRHGVALQPRQLPHGARPDARTPWRSSRPPSGCSPTPCRPM